MALRSPFTPTTSFEQAYKYWIADCPEEEARAMGMRQEFIRSWNKLLQLDAEWKAKYAKDELAAGLDPALSPLTRLSLQRGEDN